MAKFTALELDHVVINKDNELLEKQFEDMQHDMDGTTNVVAARDLAGLETYEQNDAALNTFLMEQRQSLRGFDAPEHDSYRDSVAYQDDRNYSLLRKSSFLPAPADNDQANGGQDPQMDDLIAQNFAKLM